MYRLLGETEVYKYQFSKLKPKLFSSTLVSYFLSPPILAHLDADATMSKMAYLVIRNIPLRWNGVMQKKLKTTASNFNK